MASSRVWVSRSSPATAKPSGRAGHEPHDVGGERRGEHPAGEHREHDAGLEPGAAERGDERPGGHDGDRDLGGVHRADREARRQAAVQQERGDDRSPGAHQPVGDAARGGATSTPALVERRQRPSGSTPTPSTSGASGQRPAEAEEDAEPDERGAARPGRDARRRRRRSTRIDVPSSAPIAPGMASWSTRRSVDVPEAPVRHARHQPGGHLGEVHRGRRGRRADARCSAGCVEDVGPKPMPSAPSTSEARNPASADDEEVAHRHKS